MSWAERDKKVVWHPFTNQRRWEGGTPLVIERGQGNWLIDDQGRRYLDGVSSLWCNVHGHAHPRLLAALQKQAEKIAHTTFLGLTHPPAIELAEKLVALAPSGLGRVFYSDSGASAVEVALKLAIQLWRARGQAQRTRFARLEQAYHGDTLGAVGVGGIEVFHRMFGAATIPSVPLRVPTREAELGEALDGLARALSEPLAAVVLEPLVQGAAGMLLQPKGFLSGAAALCRRAGVPLIVDEVATGFGRTGTMFACEQEGVSPDFLCLGKGLSAGYLPLSATLATQGIYDEISDAVPELATFFHGHTFTANPIACAVAIESLELFHVERTLDNVRQRADQLGQLLAGVVQGAAPGIQVRQCGLMVGIDIPGPPLLGARICEAARSNGVILRPLGNVVVWMPPLSLNSSEAELLAEATGRAIRETLP